MSQENVKGKYYLGRKVVDIYGRTLGKVVGYYIDKSGSPPLLGIELLEGDFDKVPSQRLIDEANILVFSESWKTKSENLAQSLSLGMRKILALEKLYNTGEISLDAYEGLRKDFDNKVQDLKTQSKTLMDRLEERAKALNVKLKEVEDYFVNVKVAHELVEMDDEAYRISRDALHDLINRLQTEQKDIETALDLQRTPFANKNQLDRPSRVEPKESLPETPIILKIKEAEE